MYESLLDSTKKYFSQVKRNSGEIKAKLQELFEDNAADYDKFHNWYNPNKFLRITNGKDEFEHYEIEKYKKSVFGDSYAIKEYKPYY